MRGVKGETIYLPAAVDVHVHPREPGSNKSETIESALIAAANGGVRMIGDMPNNPGNETWWARRMLEKHAIARRANAAGYYGTWAGANHHQYTRTDRDLLLGMVPIAIGKKDYANITTSQTHAPMLDLIKQQDDDWIARSKELGTQSPIAIHAEGRVGLELARHIARQEHFVHWCHLSTEEEVEHAQQLQQDYGDFFTAGVTPHHLLMTDDDEEKYGSLAQCKPEIQDSRNRRALWNGLVDGVIAIVESDHAPHPMENKVRAMSDIHGHAGEACYGLSGGLELMIPLLMGKVATGKLSLERMIDATYTQPKRMLGLPEDSMQSQVEFTFDPHWIKEDELKGASRNTPMINWYSGGRVGEFTDDMDHVEIVEAQQRAA